MINLQDVWSAVDHAYEAIADLQFNIADRSRMSGDTTIYNRKEVKSTMLLAAVQALEELNLNVTIVENRIVERVYNNIKTLTKDIRRWD